MAGDYEARIEGSELNYRRQLADGRVIEVIPLTFGRARVIIGDGFATYDDGW